MRGVTDGRFELGPEVRRHLELCLDCRACETACPSGVQYGKLIEPFRVAMEQTGGESKSSDWFHRWILFGLFPYPNRLRAAIAPARVAQGLGLHQAAIKLGLTRLLPARLRQLVEMLPPLATSEPALPEFLPAIGPRRARVALFTGCVGDAMFRSTNWATARVLQHNGCDVVVPRGQGCCGAIHFHAGASDPARAFADANVAGFPLDDVDAVIVNVAGCGAMLKDYRPPLARRRQARPARTIRRQGRRTSTNFSTRWAWCRRPASCRSWPPITTPATWDTRRRFARPRAVCSRRFPAWSSASCPRPSCAAGRRAPTTSPSRKWPAGSASASCDNIQSTGARVVVTANAGCLLQIAREARRQGERLWIAHPMDLLDLSYRQQPPPRW